MYGNNKWQLNPAHYLDLLKMRPQAYHSARPIRQWQQAWPEALHKLQARFCEAQGESRGIKDFIEVLWLYQRHNPAEVDTAVERSVAASISSSAGVIHLVQSAGREVQTPEPLPSWESLPVTDISQYGELEAGGV